MMGELVYRMKPYFSDFLNAKLDQLVGEGYEVRRIFASMADIEQLFTELGDGAVLMDCDPSQDRAWYRQYEISANEASGTKLMYCRGDECWFTQLEQTDQGEA